MGGGPRFYARWRAAQEDGTRGHVERPMGNAWVVPLGDPGAKPGGRVVGRKWCERSGRPKDGALTVQAAERAIPGVVEAWEAEQAAAAAEKAKGERLTMRDLGDRYLAWGSKDDPHDGRRAWKHSAHATNMPT
jgi:hypothetical protein